MADAAGRVAQAPFLPSPDEKAAAVDIGILLSQDVYRALHDKFPERSIDSMRRTRAGCVSMLLASSSEVTRRSCARLMKVSA